MQQLLVAAERLVELPAGADVVAERGPVDFLAYLAALADLGRRSAAPDLLAVLRATTAEAMAHVDLLVVLPLESPDGIRVPDDEDPDLREAMDDGSWSWSTTPTCRAGHARRRGWRDTRRSGSGELLAALAHPTSRP